MNLTIRPTTEADIPRLAQLVLDLQAMHVAAYPDIFHPFPDDKTALHESYRERFARGDTGYAAVIDGEIVGYMICSLSQREAGIYTRAVTILHISEICVAPEFRSQGIGKVLLDYAKDVARDAGAGFINLTVWAFNEDALRFYEREGYHIQRNSLALRLTEDDRDN